MYKISDYLMMSDFCDSQVIVAEGKPEKILQRLFLPVSFKIDKRKIREFYHSVLLLVKMIFHFANVSIPHLFTFHTYFPWISSNSQY